MAYKTWRNLPAQFFLLLFFQPHGKTTFFFFNAQLEKCFDEKRDTGNFSRIASPYMLFHTVVLAEKKNEKKILLSCKKTPLLEFNHLCPDLALRHKILNLIQNILLYHV